MAQINSIVEGLNSLLSSSPVGSLGVSLLYLFVTASMCYLGFKFLRLYVLAAGAYVGCLIGYAMAIALNVTTQRSVTWGLVLGFGVALGLTAFFLEKAGCYGLTAFLAFVIGNKALSAYLSGAWLIVISIVLALVLGGLALQFARAIVIVLFPLAGGFAFASYLVHKLLPMVGSISNESVLTAGIFIIGIGMFISGFLVQLNAK